MKYDSPTKASFALVEILRKKYNTMHFNRYISDDSKWCISIGSLTVAVFTEHTMNQTTDYIQQNIIEFCDINIQLIRNEHKKLNIQRLKKGLVMKLLILGTALLASSCTVEIQPSVITKIEPVTDSTHMYTLVLPTSARVYSKKIIFYDTIGAYRVGDTLKFYNSSKGK
jgi:hypothetical protein